CQKNLCLSSSLWKHGNRGGVEMPRVGISGSMPGGAIVGGGGAPCAAAPSCAETMCDGKRPVIDTTIRRVAAAPAEADADENYELTDDLSAGQQRDRLLRAMEKAGWVQAKAARLLNLTPRQVGYALKKYNIEVKRI
ncbi:MAG TPA: helix-turn-helix domain-containing protein, partial [Patescibacteria group bacterium]|nr:helix-turn-helix domain-containing protein [Patescibacteria group bacterium]